MIFNVVLFIMNIHFWFYKYFYLDIRDLIQLDDAMEDEELRFGPNGGLVFCME